MLPVSLRGAGENHGPDGRSDGTQGHRMDLELNEQEGDDDDAWPPKLRRKRLERSGFDPEEYRARLSTIEKIERFLERL